MDPIKFLDSAGLIAFWEKIKTFVTGYTYGKSEVWNKEETYNKDQINDLIGAPHFIGTLAEYDAVKDTIAINTIVIITDDMGSDIIPPSEGASSSILGQGVLGQMILG